MPALNWRIVDRRSLGRHGYDDPFACTDGFILIGRILEALIGMQDAAGYVLSFGQLLIQCIHDEFIVVVSGDDVSHDPHIVEIDDRGQIGPSVPEDEIGHIGTPFPVRPV